MSTHSLIALRSGDTYQTIYCHWDGYPDYMLKMLSENYNSWDRASQLISFGDASSIGPKLSPEEGKESEQDECCVFYHRDRKEDWNSCRPVCYVAKELFKQNTPYIYVFENGGWTVYPGGRDGRVPSPLQWAMQKYTETKQKAEEIKNENTSAL